MMHDRFFRLVGSLFLFFFICLPFFGNSQQIHDSISKSQVIFISGGAKIFGNENLYIAQEDGSASKFVNNKPTKNVSAKKKIVSLVSKKPHKNKFVRKTEVKNDNKIIFYKPDATEFFVNQSSTLKSGILTSVFVYQHAKEVEVFTINEIKHLVDNSFFTKVRVIHEFECCASFSIRPPPTFS